MNTAPSAQKQPVSIIARGLNVLFLIILLLTGTSLVWLGGTLLSLGGSGYLSVVRTFGTNRVVD